MAFVYLSLPLCIPHTPSSTSCSLVRRKAPFIPFPVLHLTFSSPYLTRNSPNPPRPSTTPIQPIHDADLFRSSHNVAYYLPRNVMLDGLVGLLSIYHCKFNDDYNCYAYGSNSIEALGKGENGSAKRENRGLTLMGVHGTKSKAVACYFGTLAVGQEAFEAIGRMGLWACRRLILCQWRLLSTYPRTRM
jgi:hypothetical protein